MSNRGRQPLTVNDARMALALALDGAEPINHGIALEACRVARKLVTPRWSAPLQALATAPTGAICVVGASADDIGSLLASLGARFVTRAIWDDGVDRARIAFLGCPRHDEPFESRRLLRFMAHGGLLVTSDHAAALPALRDVLPRAGRGAPGRARARDARANVDALLPVVYLPAGHDRLAALPRGGRVRTLAADALTDDPLVVLARVGAGGLLHAVPHWFQDEPTCLTDLERRPAMHAPAYASLGITRADITVGDVQAATAMLALLLEGIEAVVLADGAWRPVSMTTDERHADV